MTRAMIARGSTTHAMPPAREDIRANVPATCWLVLTLVIEKPSYGYEIGQRYERRFGTFQPTSKSSIYGALAKLEEAGLAAPLPPAPGSLRGNRRMRVAYTPTSSAMPAHRHWITAPVTDEHWHRELFVRIATAHLHGISTVLGLLESYARLAEQHQERIEELVAERCAGEQQSVRSLSALQLLSEQQRVTAARIAWATSARRELHALIDR